MQAKYPNFREALLGLGDNPQAIADRLDVHRRMVFHYLAGTHLPRAEKLVRFPELLDALRRDAETTAQVAA